MSSTNDQFQCGCEVDAPSLMQALDLSSERPSPSVLYLPDDAFAARADEPFRGVSMQTHDPLEDHAGMQAGYSSSGRDPHEQAHVMLEDGVSQAYDPHEVDNPGGFPNPNHGGGGVGLSFFADPCIGILAKLPVLKNEKDTLQEDLQHAAPGQKGGLAAQIKVVQQEIAKTKAKYADCCLMHGGKSGGLDSFPTSTTIRLNFITGEVNGEPVRAFTELIEFILSPTLHFFPFWHERFVLSSPPVFGFLTRFVHTVPNISNANFTLQDITSKGTFDPVNGSMSLIISAKSLHFFDSGNDIDSGSDHIVMDLSTEFPGDQILQLQEGFRAKTGINGAMSARLGGAVSISGNGFLSKVSGLNAIIFGKLNPFGATLEFGGALPSPFLVFK